MELRLDGAIWIVSYVVLCLTVLTLGLAVVALYATREDDRARNRWPLRGVGVGQLITEALPALIAEHAPADGFLVVADDSAESGATTLSVCLVAQRWGHRVEVWVHGVAPWLEGLGLGSVHSREVDDATLFAVRPSILPVVLFLKEGRVIDAAVGVERPSDVSAAFRTAAEPLRLTRPAADAALDARLLSYAPTTSPSEGSHGL